MLRHTDSAYAPSAFFALSSAFTASQCFRRSPVAVLTSGFHISSKPSNIPLADWDSYMQRSNPHSPLLNVYTKHHSLHTHFFRQTNRLCSSLNINELQIIQKPRFN